MRVAVVIVLTCAACGDDATPPAPDAPANTADATPGAPDAGTPDGGFPGFVRVPDNEPAGYLCTIVPGGDPVNIACDLAAGRYSDRDPSVAPPALKIVTWNIRYGVDHATIVSELQSEPDLMDADVLLLTEVGRLSMTSTPPGLDQARELAMTLAMDYAFAVEWDRRELPAEQGEHGEAILSKYPIGNATQIRHTPLNDWYAEDMLYGGRITLGADLLVAGQLVRVYASHLCTRGTGDAGRAMQGAEIRADAELPARPAIQVVGGDLNTWNCNPSISDCTTAPAAEQVVEDFLAAAWLDGTAGFTGHTQLGEGFFPQRLDWLFYRGTTATPGARVDATGSDHLPLFFSLDL